MNIEIGAVGVAEMLVTDNDLATQLSRELSDPSFPPVFATSRMIALMEVAGANLLQPLLKEGEMSVGVGVDILHTAATPVGVKVRAEARFTGMDGKLYVFEVAAHDAGGEIGRGIHKRAIVSRQRLLAGAQRRCPA